MSLSVVAGRSHSGFRAAVYGIHFDPWGFDTLLYFVKMVAVFCFNGCREFAFFCLCEGVSRGGLPYIDFLSTSGIHPPPLARPFSKGLLASDYFSFAFAPLRGSILRFRRAPSLRGYPLRNYLSFAFIPLRGSILRLRRAPSLRGYPLRTISLSLSHRCDGLGSINGKRSWMMFSMYCPTFLRLCSMSRFEKRMTRMSYFSMRLLRFSSYFIPSKERCCAPSTSMTSRAFLQKKSTI